MSKTLKFLRKVNVRSLYYNLKLLPFSQAIKMPILISNRVLISSLKGSIVLNGEVSPGLVQIGYGRVGIFDYVRSRSVIDIDGTMRCNGKVRIGHGSKIHVGPSGELVLGDNFLINAESTIVANSKVTFGNNVLLSWDVLVMDDDFHSIIDVATKKQINTPKPIVIGSHVWIGARCLILKGSVMPDNSILAANTMLAGKLQKEGSVYGGNPVKVIKENIEWLL